MLARLPSAAAAASAKAARRGRLEPGLEAACA